MKRQRQTLTDALAELERTDPDVRAAAERYDFVVWRILRKAERQRQREAGNRCSDSTPAREAAS